MLLKVCWELWGQRKRWDQHVAAVFGRLDKWSRTLREKECSRTAFIGKRWAKWMSLAHQSLFYSDLEKLFTSVWQCISCEPHMCSFHWCVTVAFCCYMLPLRNYLTALTFLSLFAGDNEEKALLLPSPYAEGHKQQSVLLLLLKQGSLKGFPAYKKT